MGIRRRLIWGLPSRLLRNAVCWLASSQGAHRIAGIFVLQSIKGQHQKTSPPTPFRLTKTDIVLSEGTPQPIPFETGEVTIGEPPRCRRLLRASPRSSRALHQATHRWKAGWITCGQAGRSRRSRGQAGADRSGDMATAPA